MPLRGMRKEENVEVTGGEGGLILSLQKDCKTFGPMACIRSVTARPTPQ
jgi:hypothetical protein